jgi:hypothetical protein
MVAYENSWTSTPHRRQTATFISKPAFIEYDGSHVCEITEKTSEKTQTMSNHESL